MKQADVKISGIEWDYCYEDVQNSLGDEEEARMLWEDGDKDAILDALGIPSEFTLKITYEEDLDAFVTTNLRDVENFAKKYASSRYGYPMVNFDVLCDEPEMEDDFDYEM